QIAVLAMGARPFRQEVPAPFAELAVLAGKLELGARPENRPLGWRIEPLGVEHGPLVMIAEEDNLALHHLIHALAWIRSVADHIPEAVDLLDGVLGNIIQNRLQGFEIAVDIADDG